MATSSSPASAEHRLQVRRTIDAPAAEVFAAWLDSEGMAQWMCPGPTVEARCRIDARVGGGFRIVMIGPNGETYDHEGEYRVIDPPRRLEFTWISKGTELRPSVVTIDLTDLDGRTELVLTHEGLPSAQAAESHTGGWASIVEKLAAKLGKAAAGGAAS